MPQMTLQQAYDLGLQHYNAGRTNEAEQVFRQILAQLPTHVDSLNILGLIAYQAGHLAAAADLIRKAIALQPQLPQPYCNLGNILKDMNQLEESLAAYRQAIALKPDFPEAYSNLGNALRDAGQLEESIAACRHALALKPNYPEAHNNLANALHKKGDFDESIASSRQALALNPIFIEAHNTLGSALRDKGDLDEAIAAFHQALALNPNFAVAHYNLANTLRDAGDLDQALATYRHVLALQPNSPDAHANLLFTMHYHPGSDARAMAQELTRWYQQFAQPLTQFLPPHPNDRNPNRPLRIGYVSGDFRTHASSLFLVPLFENHNPTQFELFCYAQVSIPDEITHRLQKHVPHWRTTVGLTDNQIDAQIRQDQIDILVDLKLHTIGNRLLVFARKPAPIQVTWLGYPGSTGLPTIDYRLSDPYLDPPGTDESVYSEKTLRLPDTFWCYDPLDARDLPTNPLPALANGHITFGCLNSFTKLNPSFLSLFAQILKAVPNSRLILLVPPGTARERTTQFFQQKDISSNRLEFLPRQLRKQYMESYHKIDIALDTFPCNGHTTSLDSLWMAVPVVTLVGQTTFGRAGLSQLTNLNLPDLIAQTPEQYLQIATTLAQDLPRLQILRSTLRDRLQKSPLMNAPLFAQNIEFAYRTIWQKWCADHPTS